MTRLLNLVAASVLLLSSVGCCCLGGGGGCNSCGGGYGYGAAYPPQGGGCPGGACGIGAAPGPGGVAQQNFNSYGTAQAAGVPGVPTANGPVALGPIIPGPVSYSVPATTTTYLAPTFSTAALQPLPPY